MNEDTKDDIVAYRQQKAHTLLHEVKILLDNELWNSAINRMYYTCFHAVSALLIMHDIEVKTHSGVRQAFALHFVKTGLVSLENNRVFSKIYDKRQASDYDDFIYFTKEEVEALYPQIDKFIDAIDELISRK